MTPDERSTTTMHDDTPAAHLAALRAELAREERHNPGPLGARDHAAYLGALRRAITRARAELDAAEAPR